MGLQKLKIMKKGDKVKMSKALKENLIQNDCKEHVDEFGDCVGTIELIDIYHDADIRWEPSKLKYAYPLEFLELA